MFEELIQIARERDEVRQIELEFIEGNSRARSLSLVHRNLTDIKKGEPKLSCIPFLRHHDSRQFFYLFKR